MITLALPALILSYIAGRFTSVKISVILLTVLLVVLVGWVFFMTSEGRTQLAAMYDSSVLVALLAGHLAFPIFVAATYGLLIGQWSQKRRKSQKG
ncbi:MAG: hypothetical protein ACTIKR_00895 [Advenella sp.]|uniref:Uncharacterized protein n=1 Tax=Advenella kashmirensis TaxID=310575 RepID=A0A356LBY7_9BURK|nr:hypothetical protein [Advenella sp. FME57]HBP28035.1 hypothetical protein [Advenella kashmirensis]